MSHGQYGNDDTVDIHGVLVGRWRPGTVFAIGRAGLFSRTDGGASWSRVKMGVEPKTTVFALALDARQPRRMYRATSGGEVFASEDGGESWVERPLPTAATQVYAMECA